MNRGDENGFIQLAIHTTDKMSFGSERLGTFLYRARASILGAMLAVGQRQDPRTPVLGRTHFSAITVGGARTRKLILDIYHSS